MKKFAVALALVVSTSAFALTLKEKKQVNDWNDYLNSTSESYVKTFEEKCGYKLPVKFEEAMVTPFMAASAHVAAYCDGVRSSMSSMCEDKTSKEAISKKVKSVNCKLGKGDELSFKFNGSTLDVSMGVGAANIDSKTREWLENNL